MDFFCHIAAQKLASYFQEQGLDDEHTFQWKTATPFQFPLVCTSNCHNNDSSSSEMDSSSCLRIHPDLFTMTYNSLVHSNVHSVPFEQKAKGSFGRIYADKDNDYIIKVELIQVPLRSVNARNKPLVELEKRTNMYVTYPFIAESLSMFALNRMEEEQKGNEKPLLDTQRYSVPKILYTAIVQHKNLLYSAIVMENIKNAVTVNQIMYNAVITEDYEEFKMVYATKVAPLVQALQFCPLRVRHYDTQTGNLLYDGTNAFVIDFGLCQFLLPKKHLSNNNNNNNNSISLCGNEYVAIKSNTYPSYETSKRYIHYNLSLFWISIWYYLGVVQQTQPELTDSIAKFLQYCKEHYEVDEMANYNFEHLYLSKQFERALATFTLDNTITCTAASTAFTVQENEEMASDDPIVQVFSTPSNETFRQVVQQNLSQIHNIINNNNNNHEDRNRSYALEIHLSGGSYDHPLPGVSLDGSAVSEILEGHRLAKREAKTSILQTIVDQIQTTKHLWMFATAILKEELELVSSDDTVIHDAIQHDFYRVLYVYAEKIDMILVLYGNDDMMLTDELFLYLQWMYGCLEQILLLLQNQHAKEILQLHYNAQRLREQQDSNDTNGNVDSKCIVL